MRQTLSFTCLADGKQAMLSPFYRIATLGDTWNLVCKYNEFITNGQTFYEKFFRSKIFLKIDEHRTNFFVYLRCH